jgi:sugar phosphate isomerase/epimerase
MNNHIGKELAAREIAKALAKLSIDELKKVAARYDVDISDALEGDYFTKADLSDEDESLTDLAKRIGSHPVIDAANKLDALAKRMDAQDAALADLKGGMFADLEKMAAGNRETVAFWQRHNDRLSK